MHHKYSYRLYTLALCGLLLVAAPWVGAEESRGVVLPGQPAATPPTVVTDQNLELSVDTTQPQFGVGEAVQFKVQGNREYYLYIYHISAEGEVIALYPNKREPDNRLKGGVEHTVPSRYNITVDDPGQEKVLVVASLAPQPGSDSKGFSLPIAGAGTAVAQADRIIRELDVQIVADQKVAFTVATEPADARVRVMNIVPTYQPAMLLAAGEYRLQVSAEGYETAKLSVQHDNDHTTHKVTLKKLGQTGPETAPQPEPVATRPTVLLASEQRVYTSGDTVEVQYGATASGWLHLYLALGNELKPLTSKAAEAGNFYTLKAKAREPFGEQSLVVLWSEDETVSEDALATLKREIFAQTPTQGGQSRALGIVVDSPITYRVLPLLINKP